MVFKCTISKRQLIRSLIHYVIIVLLSLIILAQYSQVMDQFKYGTHYLEHQNWDICITTTSSSGIPIDKFNEIVSEENIITKYQKIFW